MTHSANPDKARALARSPWAVLAALTPRLQNVAVTVMLKQNNAPICKDILLGKLEGWEASVAEYQLKAPHVLAEAIAELTEKAKASRFALGLPEMDAVPPAIAYVSVENLSVMREVAAGQIQREWTPAALSSTKPMKGGPVGAWVKRGPTQQHRTRGR